MPQISSKGQLMPPSPIRKLVPYAEEAKRKGRTVYHLNIGQPDIETPQIVLDGLKKVDLKVIEYSHSAGNESYRKGLAKYYDKYGIKITHNDIIVTTGGSEALVFGFMTCLDQGDEVIIPEPFYANYNGFAVMAGVTVKPITASIENGYALPPIEEFEKLITPKTKAILICNPGNPTGYLYSKKELEALRDIVKKHDLFLFADEVYREFCYDGAQPYSAMNLEGIENNVILVDSVSKRYSMCGARIGALITRNQEVIAAALKFGQARLSPPTFGQIASEIALDTPEIYFENVVNEYVQRRNILVDGLNKIEGVMCPKPGGAFYAMARLPIDNSDKFCQWMLEEFEFENATVMMAPATGFYASKGLGQNEVRVAYVLNQEALKKSIEILDAALKVYPGRTINVAKKATTV
ncbi:MAG TPA: pyridoxal phosphate-dependent aminotransferase [Flavobacteriales bacterium]|nr:pyridoxal phosphate-dependent aminotransferase [Flavobacteriales bacterium]HRE73886.1 pyridoxal phosphate-dependent aminotransferase [Flavobacteriales bacterium]HRE98639.1 pyridoxal phosphate-dependent aminotransferase [Flavobacteriales bacterium]HRJ36794.1 pyridoxal phosphate-dependent aminotransferase [Flavobacteriales bacterium]HRJ38304.1 pyridoxal phosphate-dependent aminotransferase [Flavobacteriales bacterium]